MKMCDKYNTEYKYSGGISVKKIIAFLLILAAVLSFASCKVDSDEEYTPDVYQSNLAEAEAEASRQAAESVKAEEEKEEAIDEYMEKVGKTEKKTKIVVNIPFSHGRKYQVFEFNRKGEFKSRKIYFFYNTSDRYYAGIDTQDSMPGQKVIDKDKDMRMVVVRDDDYDGKNFDETYESLLSEGAVGRGYTIIE